MALIIVILAIGSKPIKFNVNLFKIWLSKTCGKSRLAKEINTSKNPANEAKNCRDFILTWLMGYLFYKDYTVKDEAGGTTRLLLSKKDTYTKETINLGPLRGLFSLLSSLYGQH